ncbi:hypothetical protein ACPXCE_03465 [Streptomyces sp. DT24]|uniref:hypothetical protein n=1 Tax=Streptomyces sp. DT24 TaxID=3416520 RepID=UPI003CE9E3F2
MARISVRPGVNPDEPDVPVVVLLVDPDGPPGERAVARLGGHCYEGDGVLFLARTDGWAEHTLDADRLVVDVVVHPYALERIGVDVSAFPGHSAVDREAASVLRVKGPVDPGTYARAAPGTVVFTARPDRTLDDALTDDDDWPMLLAPPPER